MLASHKLDQTNRQGLIGPPFDFLLGWSNMISMGNGVDIASVRAALQRIMDRDGVKPTTLSLKVGTNRTLVKNLLESTGDIHLGTLTKLAGALNVQLADLLSAPRVPIGGRIGAGGSIIFDEPDADGETVSRPPNVSGELVALMVDGSSMLPKYREGDIIYIRRDHDGVLPDDIGDDCAVRLPNGETFIKQLIQGSEAGRFTLLSLNAPPMENVEVQWATRVLFIMPARSRLLLS